MSETPRNMDRRIPSPTYNGTLANNLEAIFSLQNGAKSNEITHWIGKFEIQLKSGTDVAKASAFRDLLTLLKETERLSPFHQGYICTVIAEHGLERGRTKKDVLEWAFDSKKHMAMFREGNPDPKVGKAEALFHLLQLRADKVLLEIEISRQVKYLRENRPRHD